MKSKLYSEAVSTNLEAEREILPLHVILLYRQGLVGLFYEDKY